MKSFTTIFMALLMLALQCDATYTYYTQQLCSTRLGAKSVASAPSTTYALTVTLTRHVTSTSISTSISTSTSTVMVPTANGFTPLASENGYVAKRSVSMVRRASTGVTSSKPSQSTVAIRVPAAAHAQCIPPQYPQSVLCGALVEAVTVLTATKTGTATSITVTTTSIVTGHAACQTNNLVASGNNGAAIRSFNVGNSAAILNSVDTTDSTGTQCCEICQQSANCAGFAQRPDGTCFYITNPSGQCDGSQNYGDSFTDDPEVSSANGFIVGNGNCGQLEEKSNACIPKVENIFGNDYRFVCDTTATMSGADAVYYTTTTTTASSNDCFTNCVYDGACTTAVYTASTGACSFFENIVDTIVRSVSYSQTPGVDSFVACYQSGAGC